MSPRERVEVVTDFIQNCIDGVMVGSGYALLAIGFTIIFGVLRRINLAYGASIMLGAFFGTLLYVQFQAQIFTVAVATVIGAVLAGMYVERLCFWAIRRGAVVASLVSTFAIWMQLEEVASVILPERTYPFPPLTETALIELGPFFLRSEYLAMLVVAVVLVADLLSRAQAREDRSMKLIRLLATALVASSIVPAGAWATERPRADVECTPTDQKLVYDCMIVLTGKNSGAAMD